MSLKKHETKEEIELNLNLNFVIEAILNHKTLTEDQKDEVIKEVKEELPSIIRNILLNSKDLESLDYKYLTRSDCVKLKLK